MTKPNSKCKDCGIDTTKNPKDYYMVTAEIWNKYGLGGCKMLKDNYGGWEMTTRKGKGMLCMDCLEDRMGRKLKKEDIMDCRVSREWNPYTRKLLLMK